jgi:hypothetical protein
MGKRDPLRPVCAQPGRHSLKPTLKGYFYTNLVGTLTRALEEAYKVGQKPVGADMIDSVLAKDINGLEPRLTREGYNTKVLAELLNAKPREIKAFFRGQLAAGRTQELQTELLTVGSRFDLYSHLM